MKLIKYPSKEQWTELLKRPALNTESLFDTVRSIINKVRTEGDKAVLEYEAAFDKVTLSALAVTPEEVQAAGTLVNDELKAAISLAKQNIETFHSSQRFVGKKVETMNGVTCWQKSVGIEKVGLYIPGGTAPLFSTVLMEKTCFRKVSYVIRRNSVSSCCHTLEKCSHPCNIFCCF